MTNSSAASAASAASESKLAGYETTFITRSEMTDDALKALQERLIHVVGSFQGEVVLSEDWGKRKLAYTIQKETRGHYTYLVYSGKGEVVHEMERNLRLHEHVLRFLTVNLETEFDPEAFRKRRAEVHAAAKRREEEREARREERAAERRGYDSDDRGDYRGHHKAYEADVSTDETLPGSEE
jgi:small subunit ribosomal protein S6